MTEYKGQPFDPTLTELLPHGWDHDHCEFCMATIMNKPVDDGFTSAYTSDGRRWLCPHCYTRIVERGEDPVTIVEQDRASTPDE